MSIEDFAEAHKTLLKVMGNILADPTNEKYRTLRKENAAVKVKLRHPACIAALKLCGFTDTPEAYVCRPAVDLALMRGMCAALKANPAPVATQVGSVGASAAADARGGAATRLVNGVIVRPPRGEEAEERGASEQAQARPAALAEAPRPKTSQAQPGVAAAATAPAPAVASASAEAPKPKASQASAGGGPKKTAFDFQRPVDHQKQKQDQETALAEARRQQKERYRQGVGTAGYPAAGGAAAPQQPQPQQQPAPSDQQCALQ